MKLLDLNNVRIGIFEYLQKFYLNHLFDFSKTPITFHEPTKQVIFTNKFDAKQVFQNEVLKLIKENFLYRENNHIYISEDYRDFILYTNFDNLLPKSGNIEKLPEEAKYLLKILAEAKEENSIFHTSEIKNDFSNFQTLIKDWLVPLELIYLENDNGIKMKPSQIYTGNREISLHLYYSGLSGNLIITQKGIDFLKENNIYFMFDAKINEETLKEAKNSETIIDFLNILKQENIPYELKMNDIKEVKIIHFGNMNEHFYLRKIIYNKDKFKNINLIIKY